MPRPTIPQHFERFCAYYAKNPVWGSLHIVLDDQNLGDDSVRFCIDYAKEHGDEEGHALGLILLEMSKTQRGRLDKLVFPTVDRGTPPPWRTEHGYWNKRAIGEVFHLDENQAERAFAGSGQQDFVFAGWHRIGRDGLHNGPHDSREEALKAPELPAQAL